MDQETLRSLNRLLILATGRWPEFRSLFATGVWDTAIHSTAAPESALSSPSSKQSPDGGAVKKLPLRIEKLVPTRLVVEPSKHGVDERPWRRVACGRATYQTPSEAWRTKRPWTALSRTPPDCVLRTGRGPLCCFCWRLCSNLRWPVQAR